MENVLYYRPSCDIYTHDMAISHEQFLNKAKDRSREAVAAAIMQHFRDNADYAFTYREVGMTVGRPDGLVRELLGELYGHKFIEKRGEFWATTTDTDACNAIDDVLEEFSTTNELCHESFIEEVKRELNPHDTPPR